MSDTGRDDWTITSGTANTTTFIALPIVVHDPLVERPVRCFVRTPGLKRSHRHEWHEMDHYGRYGTGFAQCVGGCIGSIEDES